MKRNYSAPKLRRMDPEEVGLKDLLVFRNAKYVTANDVGSPVRAAYLIALLPLVSILRFDLALQMIPRSDEPMDLLIVGCEDPCQALSFIQTNLAVCRSVPRVVLAKNLAASDIASLLREGFDDVILTDIIELEEAAARLFSLSNRYSAAQRRPPMPDTHQSGNGAICDVSQLTPFQRRIFNKLFECFGRTVASETLVLVSAGVDGSVSAETLRVQISRLRRHLMAGYYIESVYGSGYRLRHIAQTPD